MTTAICENLKAEVLKLKNEVASIFKTLTPIHQTTECSIQKVSPSLWPLYLTSVFSFYSFLCG